MIARASFRETLQWGQVGETAIAHWLRRRGWTILPVYEKVLDTGKSPRLFTAYHSGHGELIAPDMLAMKEQKIQWVEGKRKATFTWRYKGTGRWQDGIDVRHYQHYLHVREHSQHPLYILFLHECAQPTERDQVKGCPPVCPVGLYGAEINYLKTVVDHTDAFEANGRSYPMVYWNIQDLKRLASLEDVLMVED